jgi:hypothetical protein
VLSANQYKDIIVATATAASGAPMLAVLQKKVRGIAFSATDIKGTGKLLAGPLNYVYHQLSAGAVNEWEHAYAQVGQDQAETYVLIDGPTSRALPGVGSKVAALAITSDGVVSETPISGVSPAPAVLMSHAFMSADKMTVVGTATAANGASVLRIMQIIHPPSISLTSTSYLGTDLAGGYLLHRLASGGTPGWGFGAFTLDATGAGTYGAFRDSAGNSALPGAFALVMDQEGGVTQQADRSYHGKLSYFKDLIVETGSGSGGSFMSIAVKR